MLADMIVSMLELFVEVEAEAGREYLHPLRLHLRARPRNESIKVVPGGLVPNEDLSERRSCLSSSTEAFRV